MGAMSEGGVDQAAEAARLYGLPLDEFTAERDATAKRLRADGNREAADAIRKLRKPSVAAGAINRAVRAEPAAAKRLLKSGEQLENAQAAAISGSAADLRAASGEHAAAIEELMKAVAAELGDSKAIADRARETLRAIASDAALREQFATGTLVREGEAVGFGAQAIAGAKPAKSRAARSSKPSRKSKRAKSAAPEKPQRSAAERKRAQRELTRAERDHKAAAKELDRAERRIERARAEAEQAESARTEAAAELERAEAELRSARERATEPDP